MGYGESLQRYRGGTGNGRLVSNHPFLFVVLLYYVLMAALGTIAFVTGYTEIVSILVSWTLLLTGVVFVFGVVPIYASRYLPVYDQF